MLPSQPSVLRRRQSRRQRAGAVPCLSSLRANSCQRDGFGANSAGSNEPERIEFEAYSGDLVGLDFLNDELLDSNPVTHGRSAAQVVADKLSDGLCNLRLGHREAVETTILPIGTSPAKMNGANLLTGSTDLPGSLVRASG